MTICNDCGGTIIEYDTAAGNGFCVMCGTVVEENTIVNEVTFGETSAGAAMVQGSFVAQGATHARMNGPFGNRGSSESREQTIANASKKIQSIATILRLSDVVCLAATRLYTLAAEHKFTKGRKSLNVVAVCLYVACRQKETRNYMLIDFSDLLQVNVFELGHTYLQLVRTLNLRLPLVDPSHYISRFAALLEFGDETHIVAHDAVRLVQRFDRDWMTKGRRPAGICGAALLLAARMNNFRRSIEEIVQVVKIADTTLKKRLDEFRKTPSGSLTLADFRSVWLDEEMDPPAFTKAREKAEGEKAPAASEGGGQEKVSNDRILVGTVAPPPPLFIPDYDSNMNIDPALLPSTRLPGLYHRPPSPDAGMMLFPSTTEMDETASIVLAEEVSTFLQNPQGSVLSEALDEAEQRRLAQITVVDELTGLDEDELDRFLLTDDEVKIKERVWVELNKEYLEGLAAKNNQEDSGAPTKSRKRRKKDKPRDASTPHGNTAAESVRNLIKKNPKYSKRINYDALKDLFVDDDALPDMIGTVGEDGKDGEGLFTIPQDDKSDEARELVVEGGGGVGMMCPVMPDVPGIGDEDEDEDADGEDVSDKGDDIGVGWEEAYEQEV